MRVMEGLQEGKVSRDAEERTCSIGTLGLPGTLALSSFFSYDCQTNETPVR